MKKNKVHAKMLTNLTQADVKALFDYDAENGILIRKTFGNGCPYNKPVGHKPACDGYGQVRVGDSMYKTHRIIWLWCKGSWPKFEIDHIDKNKMNNRIENLEDVEHKRNQQNREIQSNNTSGYSGVSFHKPAGKYVARIKNSGELTHLGLFNTPEEAFLAYMLGKIKYHPTSPISEEYLRELTYAG